MVKNNLRRSLLKRRPRRMIEACHKLFTRHYLLVLDFGAKIIRTLWEASISGVLMVRAAGV